SVQASGATGAALAAGMGQTGHRVGADHASIHAIRATMRAAGLQSLAADAAAEHVSLDALVRTFGPAPTNPLVQTNNLPISPLNGATVGVAVIDSGLTVSKDINSAAFYDFTGCTSPVSTTP